MPITKFLPHPSRLIAFLATACLALLAPSAALASGATKTVTYHGYALSVPASWPVFDLSAHPTTCVRFNRNAVYLGAPGSQQNCPARAIGQADAIVVQPLGSANVPTISGGRLIDHAHGVVVTATWGADPAAVARALGISSVRDLQSSMTPMPAHQGAMSPATVAPQVSHTLRARVAAAPGAIYNGEGFDACTPSEPQMDAWNGSSPFHAVGVYIGGWEAACVNVTAQWVTDQSAAGWHLIPIYVGRQAPTNGFRWSIVPRKARAEGEWAAGDAVQEAQALGIGPGNPIYFDMEGYDRTKANTSAVLRFLQAWTGSMHAHGYLSGVYSSDDSGIADLVSKYGTSYLEPDELWIANWNGKATVSDPQVPAGDWAGGRRLHQYQGGHDAKYGGVTLNIDNDYLDGATAAAGNGPPVAVGPPAASSGPTIRGTMVEGQLLSEQHAPWSNYPYKFSYQWERCNMSGGGCVAIPGATGSRYRLTAADVRHKLRVVETAGNFIGTSAPVTSGATVSVHAQPSGYWMFSGQGNVWPSRYELFHGSPAHVRPSIAGMAATPDGNGYWLVTPTGGVYSYGTAAPYAARHYAHPIIGIVSSPTGGYWLYTAYGNIYGFGGAQFHGSLNSKHVRNVSSVVSLVPTHDGRGYWLVTRWGAVYAFGDAHQFRRLKHAHPIIGAVASPTGGYWIYTAYGNVYRTPGSPFYGSPVSSHLTLNNVTSMITTPNQRGYWIATASGQVYHYGNATNYVHPMPHVPVAGLSGP